MPPSDPARTVDEVGRLHALTGVRSGKNSYYREMRRTEERMTSAVQALQVISSALVHTRDDPRELLHEVVRAAADHLSADWTMIALRRGALPGVDDRFLALGPNGRLVASALSLPATLRDQLIRTEHEAPHPGDPALVRDGWVHVPMTLDGQVLGRLVATHPAGGNVGHEDLWVLQILVNQAALALHTAAMHATAATLQAQAQQLYDEIARSSSDLQARTVELSQAQQRVQALRRRELLDAERHRIALELHDSVAQYVLSAGLAVDVCRAEAQGGDDAIALQRLVGARDLIAAAGEQIRSVIYALHHDAPDNAPTNLGDLLTGLAARYRPELAVTLRVEGRPTQLAADAVHAFARIAGEALFNTVAHAAATKVDLRLRYTEDAVRLSVADDGSGDPRELRRLLRLEQRGDADGRHQGLVGMAQRAAGIGAHFAIRRAPGAGVLVEVVLPGPVSAGSGPDVATPRTVVRATTVTAP